MKKGMSVFYIALLFIFSPAHAIPENENAFFDSFDSKKHLLICKNIRKDVYEISKGRAGLPSIVSIDKIHILEFVKSKNYEISCLGKAFISTGQPVWIKYKTFFYGDQWLVAFEEVGGPNKQGSGNIRPSYLIGQSIGFLFAFFFFFSISYLFLAFSSLEETTKNHVYAGVAMLWTFLIGVGSLVSYVPVSLGENIGIGIIVGPMWLLLYWLIILIHRLIAKHQMKKSIQNKIYNGFVLSFAGWFGVEIILKPAFPAIRDSFLEGIVPNILGVIPALTVLIAYYVFCYKGKALLGKK